MLVGLAAYLIRRLQSVQNAAARLIFRFCGSDHVSDALVSLHVHWLRVPEGIVFKVTVQTYRSLHADAPLYRRQFTRTADIQSRQTGPHTTDRLSVPAVRLLLLDVAFPVGDSLVHIGL